MSLPRRHAARAPGGSEQQESMKELNHRLAGYIAHVGNLEESNLRLERMILERLKAQEPHPTDWSKKEETCLSLRHEISQAKLKNASLAMDVHSTEMDLNHLKSRCEIEQTNRRQLRMKMEMLQEMHAEITQLTPALECALEEARAENEFRKLEHEEAVQTLLQSGQPRNEVRIAPEEDGTGMALSQLLAELRAHYEELIFSTRVPRGLPAARAQLEKEAIRRLEKDEEDLKAAREELKAARRQWTQLQVEVESLHATEQGLQMSLCAMEQQYQSQLESLRAVIEGLESELQDVRQGMSHQLRQHKELLNTKMRLEHEIQTYRALLEKEEDRYFDPKHLLESRKTEIIHSLSKAETQSYPEVLHNGVTPTYERGDSTEEDKREDSETLKTSILLNGMSEKEGVEACGTQILYCEGIKQFQGDSTEEDKREDSETLKTSLLLNGMSEKEGVEACGTQILYCEGIKQSQGDSTEEDKNEDNETLKTSILLNGMSEKEGVEACGTITTDNVDRVIKQWESSFFKENPHLRKKSANLCFDLHMEPLNGEESPAKSEEVPGVEVRLIMKRSCSTPSVSP